MTICHILTAGTGYIPVPSPGKEPASVSLSKPAIAITALAIGAALGFGGGEVTRPDHFAAIANFAGPATSVAYERCLSNKGFGHDIAPLTLREFCGVYVTGTYLHQPHPKARS